MNITARTNLFLMRIITSVIALATIALAIVHVTPNPAQAAPSVLVPFPSLDEALDSIATFSRELNRTLNYLMSFNDTIAYYESIAPGQSVETAEHSHEADESAHETLSESLPASLGFQSFAMLSSALYDGYGVSHRFSIYGEAIDRIQRGLLIEALPMSIPVDASSITSGFGVRNHPILRGRRMHKGLDMAAPSGTPIHVTGGGTVIFSGRKNGYGNVVIVDHGYGYTTLYAHCSRLLVDEGAKVSRGDLIALVGSTGRSTGPHLHYEVRLNDVHLNPELFLIYSRDKIESLAAIADHYLTL